MPKHSTALDTLAQRTLIAMFELAAAGRSVHAGSLARALGAKPSEVGEALCRLDARGLVWLARCKLTLPGLAQAARLAHKAQHARRYAA